MNDPKITLITIDYPPMTGGVAAYLSGLVQASNGAIRVMVPSREDRFFWRFWPHWLPLVRRCYRERARATHLLVSHVFPIGTAAWIARMIGGPKYALLFHGTDLRRVRGVWKRWLFRRICRNAEALISNSEATKKELETLFRSTVVPRHVITPGIDVAIISSRSVARIALNIPEDSKVISTVARLISRKGIDDAIRAVAKLQKESNDDIVYMVIGSGPERDHLRRIATELDVAVTWIEHATNQEIKMWNAAADVFLLTGREEMDDVEGFGMVFLEAAAAGLPIVATKTGGVDEAVIDGQTGILALSGDVDAIAEGVRRLLQDDVLCRKMGEAGRARVERDFNWKERWSKLREML